jgi:hypothetical protein
MWIINNQLGRRNLTDATRIEMALLKTEHMRRQAKDNLRTRSRRETNGPAPAPVNMRREIAKIAGVGEQTVQRYIKIREKADPALLERVQKGGVKIKTASNMVKVAEVTEIFDMLTPEARREKDRRIIIKEFTECIEKLEEMYTYMLDNPSEADAAGPELEKQLRGHARGYARVMEVM